MKRLATPFALLSLPAVTFAVTLLALISSVAPASAFNLRSPQVTLGTNSLQTYLNGVGESINTGTDQLDAQTWSTSISGNAAFTLMIELAGNAPSNAIGVYNVGDPGPTLFQVFPGSAAAGWYAVASFSTSGGLVVTLFDNNSVIQGQTSYSGVNRNNFGFYLQGPGGLFFTQDARNGGTAQALTYAGTGSNFGDWWLCWDDTAGGDRDFNDAVILLQSVAPTPTLGKSWGGLKALYK